MIDPGDIDFYIVRENNEGEYSSIGGKLYEGTAQELVVQESVFTRKGVDRVMKFAFELAAKRNNKLTSATKSNGIIHTMPYWDQRFKEMGKNYPQVALDQFHIDILCAHFVQHPDWFDVVVASNLFGDILSDEAAVLTGSLGMLASATIGGKVDLYEPVHGSAPDIAGEGKANPLGAIECVAMCLAQTGKHILAAEAIRNGVQKVLVDGYRTADLTKNPQDREITTEEMGDLASRYSVEHANFTHAYHAV